MTVNDVNAFLAGLFVLAVAAFALTYNTKYTVWWMKRFFHCRLVAMHAADKARNEFPQDESVGQPRQPLLQRDPAAASSSAAGLLGGSR